LEVTVLSLLRLILDNVIQYMQQRLQLNDLYTVKPTLHVVCDTKMPLYDMW